MPDADLDNYKAKCVSWVAGEENAKRRSECFYPNLFKSGSSRNNTDELSSVLLQAQKELCPEAWDVVVSVMSHLDATEAKRRVIEGVAPEVAKKLKCKLETRSTQFKLPSEPTSWAPSHTGWQIEFYPEDSGPPEQETFLTWYLILAPEEEQGTDWIGTYESSLRELFDCLQKSEHRVVRAWQGEAVDKLAANDDSGLSMRTAAAREYIEKGTFHVALEKNEASDLVMELTDHQIALARPRRHMERGAQRVADALKNHRKAVGEMLARKTIEPSEQGEQEESADVFAGPAERFGDRIKNQLLDAKWFYQVATDQFQALAAKASVEQAAKLVQLQESAKEFSEKAKKYSMPVEMLGLLAVTATVASLLVVFPHSNTFKIILSVASVLFVVVVVVGFSLWWRHSERGEGGG